MKIEIRLARLDEAQAITDLSMLSKASNGYDEIFMAACLEELTVTPERMAIGEYWVAVEGETLCGCACLVVDAGGGSGEVHAFFIDPAFKRMGVGRMLWQKILVLANDKGIIKLRLDADPFAVPFYEAMGFVITDQVPSESIKGRSLPKMEIELS